MWVCWPFNVEKNSFYPHFDEFFNFTKVKKLKFLCLLIWSYFNYFLFDIIYHINWFSDTELLASNSYITFDCSVLSFYFCWLCVIPGDAQGLPLPLTLCSEISLGLVISKISSSSLNPGLSVMGYIIIFKYIVNLGLLKFC